MFACVYACLLVTYLLRNGCTNLDTLFLFASSWSQDGFRPKNPDQGSGFSGNLEKSGLAGNFKIFYENLRIYILKIAEIIVTKMIFNPKHTGLFATLFIPGVDRFVHQLYLDNEYPDKKNVKQTFLLLVI